MDKPSERRADSKKFGDTDIGVQDKKAGGKLEQMDGLWHKPNTITGGSADQRLRDRNYCKTSHEDSKKSDLSLKGLFDQIMCDTSGPPYTNVSRVKRIF